MIRKVNPIQNLQKMILFMKLGADFIISNWVFLNFKKKASPEKMTLPETNSKFAPENGWLEYWGFLLGFGLFAGANLLLVLGRCTWRIIAGLVSG